MVIAFDSVFTRKISQMQHARGNIELPSCAFDIKIMRGNPGLEKLRCLYSCPLTDSHGFVIQAACAYSARRYEWMRSTNTVHLSPKMLGILTL